MKNFKKSFLMIVTITCLLFSSITVYSATNELELSTEYCTHEEESCCMYSLANGLSQKLFQTCFRDNGKCTYHITVVGNYCSGCGWQAPDTTVIKPNGCGN